MSAFVTGTFRTVNIFPLNTKTIQGPNGPYEVNSIMMVVAATRNRKETVYENGVAKIGTDGQPIKEKKSDFLLVKATGEDAKAVDQYVRSYRTENGAPKLNSRHLFIQGTLETYDKEEEIEINKKINAGGVDYDVKFKEIFKHTKTIIMMDGFEFLDSKPVTETVSVVSAATTPTVTVVPTAAPAATPITNVAPVNPATIAPQVASAAAIAPVGVAFQTTMPAIPEAPIELLSETMPYQKVNDFEGLVTINNILYRVKLSPSGTIETCPF